jgi:7,8-dihydro-6-hydroxymethylpterin-pyrophosphokinase
MNALVGIESGVLRGIEILTKSIDILSEFSEVLVISSVIRSSQQDQGSSEDYLSIVLKVSSNYEPEELIKRLVQLEQYFLKEYFSKYFRAVLLVYADQMSLVPHLVLPHPQLVQNKAFLIGSIEIWGNYNHPILEKPINTLINDKDLKGVEFISPGKSLLKMKSISF